MTTMPLSEVSACSELDTERTLNSPTYDPRDTDIGEAATVVAEDSW